VNPADTPLLLIAWRRPHTLRQVIDAIRPVAPTRLYVACDGPNPERPGEAEKVAATRAVIEHEIDWPCQIERFYSDVNQGCRLGVSRAITWFFEQVEEGIILEDDVVPQKEFFDYCTVCLEKYRYDSRIWAISGNCNLLDQKVLSTLTNLPIHLRYNFSCWGWATWSNRWASYSSELSPAWFEANLPSILNFCGKQAGLEICRRAGLASLGSIDTWDYQVVAVQASRLSFTVHPSIPLIRNIGFGDDATHTLSSINSSEYGYSDLSKMHEWLQDLTSFVSSLSDLPPFVREVCDASYSTHGTKPRLFITIKRILKSLRFQFKK
jgi:hypothetical protein